MRMTGIIIIGICISSIGFLKIYKLCEKNKQLKAVLLMINKIEQSIVYKKEPLKTIIHELMKDEHLKFLFKEEYNSNDEYFKKICLYNPELCLEEAQKNSLNDFMSGLGKSDIAGQTSHCNIYYEIFQKYLYDSKDELKNKIKLYPSLSVLSGLFVILIMF